MNVGKFICRLLWKTVAIGLIIVTLYAISSPIMANQIAMTQMENSDTLYVIFSNFSNLKTIVDFIGVGVILGLGVSIESDIRKFTKPVDPEINIEHEKEN